MQFVDKVIDPFNLGGENSPNRPARVPNSGQVGSQYLDLVNAFSRGEGSIYDTQAKYQPMFENLDLSAIDSALPEVLNINATANSATRKANANDVANIGPDYINALKKSNPGQADLTDALTRTATDQLNLGDMLDPRTTNRITSGVRADWANRGMGDTDPAQFDEALNLIGGGQGLLQSREAAAGDAAKLDASLYEDPMLAAMGISSSAPAEAGTVASGAGPTLFPQNQSYDLFNTAYNANAAASIANANNAAAVKGAGMSY
jgi:hypothetical protein